MGVRLVKYNRTSANNQDGVSFNDHDELYNRDLKNQHPIYAITGLQEVLNILEDDIAENNRILVEKDKATNIRIDSIVLDIKQIQNDIQTIIDTINNLNIIKATENTNTVEIDYDESSKILKANVKVYNDTVNQGNAIQILPEGLYVPRTLAEDTETVTWSIRNTGESLKQILDTGIKFSHNTDSWDNINNIDDINGWELDSDQKIITQLQDTTTFNGIVTHNFYEDYTHQVSLKSTDTDNDDNGVIIGFVFDEYGRPHTLSAMCSRRGTSITDWALVYDYMLPDQEILFKSGNGTYGTIPTYAGSTGWNNYTSITIYITKNKNLITATCSNWNNSTLNQNTKISIDLNNYNWGYLFDGPVRYGYCNFSQQNSSFFNIIFNSASKSMQDTFMASVKVSKEDNNSVIVNKDGIYVPEFIISPDEDNILEKKEDGYYVKGLQISQKEDNSIEELEDGMYVREQSNIKQVTQNNHNFSVGNFIYYHPDNMYCLAAAIDSYDSNIVGMVTKVIDENTFEYMWSGFYKTDIFNENNGYIQGLPLYISDTEPGSVVQEQPDISKTVGYPVENMGLIISIERGIQYNQEATIGDFKTSANDYNVRSDGFIRVVENVDYKQTLINRLIESLSDDFKSKYMVLDDTNNTAQFINTDKLYETNKVSKGLNLFIKAF